MLEGDMIRRISQLLLIALCFVGTGSFLRAQDTGLISGTIRDESGAVVPSAAVTITNKATGISRNVTANGEGLFSAPALPAGDYEVRVEMQGFRTLVRPATVQAGTPTTVDVTLQLGTTQEVVNVEAATAQVNYDSHTVAGVVTRQSVENIPLNGRNMLQLATLEPGVTSTPASVGVFNAQFNLSILGGGNRNYVTVDGGSIVDNVEGSTTALNLSNEVVQEFQTSQVNFDLGTGITSPVRLTLLLAPEAMIFTAAAISFTATTTWLHILASRGARSIRTLSSRGATPAPGWAARSSRTNFSSSSITNTPTRFKPSKSSPTCHPCEDSRMCSAVLTSRRVLRLASITVSRTSTRCSCDILMTETTASDHRGPARRSRPIGLTK